MIHVRMEYMTIPVVSFVLTPYDRSPLAGFNLHNMAPDKDGHTPTILTNGRHGLGHNGTIVASIALLQCGFICPSPRINPY